MADLHLPPIGITWLQLPSRTSERYRQAVRLAGGEPVALPAAATSWAAELGTIRGLLLTGGGDVNPSRYGQAAPGQSLSIDDQRDELELAALRYCYDRGLPVLAICRGMQLANVFMGGALLQDIRGDVVHRASDGVSSYHSISLLPDTMLAGLAAGRSELVVNSRHHQGLDESRLAPGLRCSALASDGIVEGLEAPRGSFFVAVQCHPERAEEVPVLQGLFSALVEQARLA